MNNTNNPTVSSSEQITRRLERSKRIAAKSKRQRDQYRPMTKTELQRFLQETAR